LFLSLEALAVEPSKLNIATNTNISSQEIIFAEGEYVLTGNETLKQAYAEAEALAKLKASRKFGEYLEIVKMTDVKTSEAKKVISTVKAAILKYDVVSKTKKIVGDEFIVSVKIKATNDPVQLQGALDRFYANEDAKKEIALIQSQKNDLERKVRERDAALKKLPEYKGSHQNDSSGTALKLEKTLLSRQKALKKHSQIYMKTLDVFKKNTLVLTAKSSMARFNKKLAEVDNLEMDYLQKLRKLVDGVEYKFNPSDYIDPIVDAKIVDLKLDWNFGHEKSLELLHGEVKRNTLLYTITSNGSFDNVLGSKYISRALGFKSEELVFMKYTVYHVIKANNELIEFPVLLPVERDSKIRNGSCPYSSVLTGKHKYRAICFAWYGGNMSEEEFGHVAGRNSKIDEDSFRLRFGLDEDVKIETYFEIRELKTGKSLYTLNKKA
jgi:hypothetical protein